MEIPVSLVDAKSWPAGVDRAKRAYLEPLLQHGTEVYLDNAKGVEFAVAKIGDKVIPLAICDEKASKASVLSPFRHYFTYPIQEISKVSKYWNELLLNAALFPLWVLLKAGCLDRVVYINHWLLVGGPDLDLDGQEIAALSRFLGQNYPYHAQIVSGHVPALNPESHENLRRMGFHMVQSRIVHLFAPGNLAKLPRAKRRGAKRNIKVDRQLLDAAASSQVDDPNRLLHHLQRISELYSDLYLGKHSDLNPQYTESFFRSLIMSGMFSATGWIEDNQLMGFNIAYISDRHILWSIVGYDQTVPRVTGLYRRIFAHDVAVLEECNGLANWGGGASYFKRVRGARPELEFDAVFHSHLPFYRRLPWRLLELARAAKNVRRAEIVESRSSETSGKR